MDELTFVEKIKLEIEKIKAMSGAKKWDYFKTYYMTKTIIAVLLIIIGIWIGHDIRESCREILLSGCTVHVNMNEEGYRFFTEDFIKYQGKDPEKVVAQLALDNPLQFMDAEQQMDNSSYEMALIAQMAAGDYDYMLLDKAALTRFQKEELYADLEELLSPEELAIWQDRLIYFEKPDGKGDTFAGAIRLTDTAMDLSYEFDAEEVYLVLININQENGNGKRLLEYLRSTAVP